MNKNIWRLIYTIVFFMTLYVGVMVIGFEFTVLFGLAWLSADNAVDVKHE